MTKKRKFSTNLSPIKVEVKEENVLGNDYLMAKGRLKGVLKQLTEKSDSDSDSSDERSSKYDNRKRKGDSVLTPYRHTYVMKLFDRSVDLARFEEDTPLYPICRAWMQNQPRNPQSIVKRRLSSPEPNEFNWNSSMMTDLHRLPPPMGPVISRIPSPLPEQKEQNKDNINLNYDECPPVPKDILIRNHLQRWVKVKKKWIETAVKNEERYHMSTQILQTIYNKAQEAME
ncbi:protein lin-37 homolog [Tribolium madens]|uniref:protein lin-37 homolog n=1 Tax=Tribolium madens TaxID=41895 RepID=UPI001CF751CE|nr:protein lin-37 homolog [Tribolium madens]